MTNQKLWDVVVVGGGPAGLTAAIYAAREQLEVCLLEAAVEGGMMATTERVENYPGFADGVGGFELAQAMSTQAKNQGVKIMHQKATGLTGSAGEFVLTTADDQTLRAKTVILALGSKYRQLDLPGEVELIGSKIHFCATCDGAFYQDKVLAVIGGGNSAVEESVFLTRFAKQIHLIAYSELSASKVAIGQLQPLVDAGKVKVLTYQQTKSFAKRGDKVELSLTNRQTGEEDTLEVDGVFEFVGLVPQTDWLKSSGVKLAQDGAIEVDDNCQTSLPGVFAAGDVVAGATKQISYAVGLGTQAALAASRFLE